MPKTNDNSVESVRERIDKDKHLLLDRLEKTPVVGIACEKAGISRATYYRWRADDDEFRERADEALVRSVAAMNDLAESRLLKAVSEDNMTAIIFWLKSRHKAYREKLTVSAEPARSDTLSDEERAILERALANRRPSRARHALPKDLNDQSDKTI